MSTPILTVTRAGTWNLDPVHSRVDLTDEEIRAGLADTVAALAEEIRQRAKVVA
jgi:hypothetical protein